ncbi:MAG: N-acetyltransferase [Planctomycetota bacterium]
MEIRKARLGDVGGILDLIQPFVDRDIILGRTPQDMIERIRDYMVAVDEGRVVGCAALFPGWENLGEVRTVAVDPGVQKKGVGRGLVAACLDEARALGLPRVFALTYETEFFKRMGFCEVDMHTLPQKIFRDCVRCKKFPDCDEIAMVRDIT